MAHGRVAPGHRARARATTPTWPPPARPYARLVGVPPTRWRSAARSRRSSRWSRRRCPTVSTVLVPEGEFTSVTFPFLAQEARGIRVVEVPLAEIAEHVDGSTGLVALAAAQSSDGAVAPLDAVEAAAARHGVDVLLDVTQAAGWLPVDAGRFAYTVCAAYKWLLSPRGTAFLTVRRDRWDALVPAAAGWYAGELPWSSIYGTPLRLAADARRYDVSPGWHAWVGTASSLALLERVGVRRRCTRTRWRSRRPSREAAGLEPAGRGDPGAGRRRRGARAARRHGIVAAERAGRLRVSFHVNNTERGGRAGRGAAPGARRAAEPQAARKSRRPVSGVTPRVGRMSETTAPQTTTRPRRRRDRLPRRRRRSPTSTPASSAGRCSDGSDDDWVTIAPPGAGEGSPGAGLPADRRLRRAHLAGGAHPQQSTSTSGRATSPPASAGARRGGHPARAPAVHATAASSSTSTRPGTRSAWCHERPGDRGGRPRQDVRRLHRGRRRQLLGARRHGVLDARPQRRGQDHDGADDDHAQHPDQRHRPGRRASTSSPSRMPCATGWA